MARKKIDVEQIGWDEQIAENVSINGNLTLTGSFVQQGNQLKITSAGPTSLFLEADTDDATETDTAFIKMSQDGGVVTSYVGLNPANDKDPENNDYTDAVSNALIITNNYSNGVIQFGTSNSTKLTIDAAGDLGIGTNAPRCPLHVARSLSGETFSNANLSGMLIESAGSSNAYFALQVATVGGGKCFSVTNAGRVGIGTSTPNTELDVVGDLVVSGSQLKVTSTGPTSLYLQADTDNLTETDTAFIKMTQDGAYLTSYLGYTPNDSEDPEGGSLTDGLANTLLLSCHNSFPGGPPASSRIQFATEQAVRMTIEDDGKVGIGTNTPASELHVNGALTLTEKSSDPSDPAEGNSVLWMSDGTGSGDDGDIMMKITAGGVTKTITLVDFSAS